MENDNNSEIENNIHIENENENENEERNNTAEYYKINQTKNKNILIN